jgi:hypothetical protein
MRPGVENFPDAYARPPPPSEILQEPLDGDPAHYARLEHRLAVLPNILSKSLDATLEWPELVPEGY